MGAGVAAASNPYANTTAAPYTTSNAAPYIDTTARPVSSGYVPYADIYAPSPIQQQYVPDYNYSQGSLSNPQQVSANPYANQQSYPQQQQPYPASTYQQPSKAAQAYDDVSDSSGSSARRNRERRNGKPRPSSRGRDRDRDQRKSYASSRDGDRDQNRDNRRSRASSRDRKSRASSQGRDGSTRSRARSMLRERFDTSDRGMQYGALGALAGGLVGSEVGKGILPTVAGAVIGGLGANAYEGRDKK